MSDSLIDIQWIKKRRYIKLGDCFLRDLALGKTGVVTRLEAVGLTRRRLLDLGLVPGTKVEAIQKSPLGDPIAYGIRGAVIALRMEESCQIYVRVIEE